LWAPNFPVQAQASNARLRTKPAFCVFLDPPFLCPNRAQTSHVDLLSEQAKVTGLDVEVVKGLLGKA